MQQPPPSSRRRADRHGRSTAALLVVTGAGFFATVVPGVVGEAMNPLLGLLLALVPVGVGLLSYLCLLRPAQHCVDEVAAGLRAERDGARDLVARLRSEREALEGARGTAETARRAAEAQAEAKAEYLAVISREVRTPLTGVTGMTELLADTALDDEQAALVDTVRQSAEALQVVLQDVMDFAALEARELDLEDAPLDMREVSEAVIAAELPAARKKGLEIVFDCHPEMMTQSRGDAERIGRVMSVLVNNAVKFTDRGEIVVSLRSRDRAGRAEVVFEVADTGVGVAEEDRSRIFEPFARGGGKAADRYGGTGLGLAIARGLARKMSGSVELAESGVNGSRFAMKFAHRVRQTARGAAPEPDYSGERYLLIDGSQAARRVLERQLAHWGAEVVAVPSAEAGEDLLWGAPDAQKGFSAVLLDTSLGGLEPAELAARLGRSAAGVPIILLHSGDPHGARPIVSDELAVSVVPKPVLLPDLTAALETAREPQSDGSGGPVVDGGVPAALLPACIVLADDNAANRTLIEKFLADEPMTLIHAPDGVGAVEAWADWAPDLILMDVSMPRMDGLDATRRIRGLERSQGSIRVPIIALTARAMSDDREKCLAAGMDDYVAKPIRKADLKAKITQWTRARRKTA